MAKAADAFRTISEVADDLGIQKHVLRFWEVKFNQIRPMKRGGGRRYYRPEDMELLRGIRQLLHRDGYTIKGVQKILREQGVEAVKDKAREEAEAAGAGELAIEPTGKAAPGAARGRARATPAGKTTPKAIITAVIAELMQCRALLAGQDEAATGGAKAERRSRRSA